MLTGAARGGVQNTLPGLLRNLRQLCSTALGLEAATFSDASPGSTEQQRFLQVGLVGCPNAGKSELTNRLVGQKVTAVSSKRNTTVDVHLGAFTEGSTQVALLDTPGIVEYRELRHTDHQARVKSAWRTAASCNVLLLMVDADRQVRISHCWFHMQHACTVHHRDVVVSKIVQGVQAEKVWDIHAPCCNIMSILMCDGSTCRCDTSCAAYTNTHVTILVWSGLSCMQASLPA